MGSDIDGDWPARVLVSRPGPVPVTSPVGRSITRSRTKSSSTDGCPDSSTDSLWIFTPGALRDVADRQGYTEILQKAGAMLMSDTCPALGRVKPEGARVAATDSCKQAHYLPATLGLQTHFGTVEDCVESAIAGRWVGRLR